MTVEIRVPPDGGYFAGHFPGRPILPGVAALHLVVTALGRGPLAGIRHARFRRTVAPGDALALEVHDLQQSQVADAAGEERVRVTLRCDGVIVMNGELAFGPLAPPRPVPPLAVGPLQVPPLDALLPHRPPMRFVTRVVAGSDAGADCTIAIPLACALAAAGWAPALAVVEGAAQTAAAWEALRRSRTPQGSGARLGYLVALRDIVFRCARVPAEVPLVASVRLEAVALPLTHYRAVVALDGIAVMDGLLATVLA